MQEARRVYLVFLALNLLLLLSQRSVARRIGDAIYSLVLRVEGVGAFISGAYHSAGKKIRAISRAREVLEENEGLRRALVQEKLKVTRLRQELERIKTQPSLPYPSVYFARTVFLNPVSLHLRFSVAAGWGQGVREFMPVVDMKGNAVGKVVGPVLYASCWVRPITYPMSSTGVVIGQYYGVARGTGQDLLEVDYIYPTSSVSPGEEVYTSGLDGVFPPGIPLGKVVSVKRTPGLFLKIKVRANFSLESLKWVGIIRKW